MGLMDIVHTGLDVLGMVPAWGAIADVANAVIYACEGDWGNAALSMFSAIPGIGDIAGGIKLGKRGLKLADSFFGFSQRLGKARIGANGASDCTGQAIKEAQKLQAKEAKLGGRCFTGDTLIRTPKGFLPIKDIRVGDDIYSRNDKTGETGIRKVKKTFRTGAHTIYHIWLDGKEEIKTTAYHPVFVKQQGWTKAARLQVGSYVETADGDACVTKIEKERHEDSVAVYNIQVEEWESYFVSEKQVFVHNCSEQAAEGVTETNFVIFNKTHSDAKPKPRGNGPNGGYLQSHHTIQQGWALHNLKTAGYSKGLAPTITIETGVGMPHTTINKLQEARRKARIAAGKGEWDSTLQEELSYIVSDGKAAGFSDETIKKMLDQNYKMLDKLNVPYERIDF